MKEPDGMNGSLLADAIDAADALFEAQGIPWQLDINHQPATLMEIQPFAGGIGRDQHIGPAGIELVDGGAARLGGDPAMHREDSS